MKSTISRHVFPTSWILRVAVCICSLLFIGKAQAELTTVTEPLMQYGLGTMSRAAYSPNPDVPLIATGGGIGAVLWNAETGERVRILNATGHYVTSVAFSPDGKRILTGSGRPDNTARLWDAATGVEIHTFSGHTSDVNSVAFSPDGTRILTGSQDDTAKFCNDAAAAEIYTFYGHTSWVYTVDFSRRNFLITINTPFKHRI